MSDTYEPDPPPEEPPPVEEPPVEEAAAPLGVGPYAPADVWQLYVPTAIRSLYPNLRDGVDYAWGHAVPGDTGTFSFWNVEKLQPADEAAIEEKARELAAADPLSGYEPPVEPPPP